MWVWALQDPLGQTLSVLPGAHSRRLSYKRSATPEATFELDLEHVDAGILETALIAGGGGLPILRALHVERQPDTTDLRVCRFAGIYAAGDETAGTGIIAVTFRGAFEVLEGRYTDDLFARDATPAADIAVALLDLTETLDGPTGITTGTIDVTEPRDVDYQDRKLIADGILDLTDAFDFEVVPLADTAGGGTDLGRFDAWVRQGTDRPEATFGYGESTVSNCDDATRKTVAPRNRVWVTGAEGQVGLAEDGDSQDRFGVWTHTEAMSDVIDQGVLDARARELLAPMPMRTVTFTPNPSLVDSDGEPLTPAPWRDYWLGDNARLNVRKGSFNYDGEPRIDGIDIDIDDDGFDAAHTLTINAEEVTV